MELLTLLFISVCEMLLDNKSLTETRIYAHIRVYENKRLTKYTKATVFMKKTLNEYQWTFQTAVYWRIL